MRSAGELLKLDAIATATADAITGMGSAVEVAGTHSNPPGAYPSCWKPLRVVNYDRQSRT